MIMDCHFYWIFFNSNVIEKYKSLSNLTNVSSSKSLYGTHSLSTLASINADKKYPGTFSNLWIFPRKFSIIFFIGGYYEN